MYKRSEPDKEYGEEERKMYNEYKRDTAEYYKKRGIDTSRYDNYKRDNVTEKRNLAASEAKYLQERGIITPESLRESIERLGPLSEDDYYAFSPDGKMGLIRGDILAKNQPFINPNESAVQEARANIWDLTKPTLAQKVNSSTLDSNEALREMMGCRSYTSNRTLSWCNQFRSSGLETSDIDKILSKSNMDKMKEELGPLGENDYYSFTPEGKMIIIRVPR